MSVTPNSKACQTALAFIATFETLDLETNLSLRADDCRHELAPSSMGYLSPKTNEQFAEHFKSIQQVIASFPVTAKEIFESKVISKSSPADHESSGAPHQDQGHDQTQVTVWATSSATFRDEVKDDDSSIDWSYSSEYIFIFFMDRTGTKIERIIEFIDSQKVKGVQGLIKRARENLEKNEKKSVT